MINLCKQVEENSKIVRRFGYNINIEIVKEKSPIALNKNVCLQKDLYEMNVHTILDK